MIDRPPDKQKPRPSVTSTGSRATIKKHGSATRRYCTARDTALLLLAGSIMGLVFAHCLVNMSGQFGPPLDGLELLAALSTRPARKRSPPPYSKRLQPGKEKTLWVCVGAGAWDRATLETWMPGCKLVLPPDTHPSGFRWNCATGFADAVILACGKAPPFDIIHALARNLMLYVGLVLYLDPWGMTHRFKQSKEA